MAGAVGGLLCLVSLHTEGKCLLVLARRAVVVLLRARRTRACTDAQRSSSSRVATQLHRAQLALRPRVQHGGAHKGDVNPKLAVDRSTVQANEHTEGSRGPRRVSRAAIKANLCGEGHVSMPSCDKGERGAARMHGRPLCQKRPADGFV